MRTACPSHPVRFSYFASISIIFAFFLSYFIFGIWILILIWWLTWMWTLYPCELLYVYWIKSLQLIFHFHVWYHINIYVGVEGVTRYTWTCNDGMWSCEMLNCGHRIWLWIIVWLILDVIILVLWIENYAITWLVFTLRKVLMRKGLKGKCRVPS